MIIPPDQLAPETLDLLIEEFVTRDGAVHGHHDKPLAEVILQVRRQLESGHAVIVYDEVDESCSIIRKDDLNKRAPSDERNQ